MTSAKYSRYYTYIQPVIKNKIVRSYSPFVFSFIAITIFVVFAIKPTISTILNLQQEIENTRQTFEALEAKANNLTAGKANLQNLGEARTKINNAIPETTNVTSLVNSLRNASAAQASASALQVQPVVLIDNTTAGQQARLNLGEVGFSYNVQGSFDQLVKTLYNLESASRLLNISSAVISRQAEGLTVLSITGKTYFLQ